MATERFGTATWPGVQGFESCSYTCSHGTQPGMAALTVADVEANKPARRADLVLSDGIGKPLRLKDCLLGRASAGVSPGGARVITYMILDRRWKWRFGRISGRYNTRDGKGRLEKHAKEHPFKLFEYLFDAMGEKNASLRGLPEPKDEDTWPTVDWDRANPALELAALAQQFGARVVYDPVTDRVSVVRRGVGQRLRDRVYVRYTVQGSLSAKPSQIDVIGSPSTFMAAIPLEAVGREMNGDIKPINELSYKPEGGWATSGPPFFPRVAAPKKAFMIPNPFGMGDFQFPGLVQAVAKDDDLKALARSCVFRWYRPKLVPPEGVRGNGQFMIPGYPRGIQDIHELELMPGIVNGRNDEAGQPQADPPECYGSHYQEQNRVGANSEQDALIKIPFTIGADNIVRFSSWLIRTKEEGVALPNKWAKNGPSGSSGSPGESDEDPARAASTPGFYPALPVLITSVRIRHPSTHALIRPELLYKVPGGNPDVAAGVLKKPDILLATVCEYDRTTWVARKIRDNREDAQKKADYYAQGALLELTDEDAATVTYPGVVPISLDGAISQVSWSVGGGRPCTTTASRNSEHDVYWPPYPLRREKERLKTFFDAEIWQRLNRGQQVDFFLGAGTPVTSPSGDGGGSYMIGGAS